MCQSPFSFSPGANDLAMQKCPKWPSPTDLESSGMMQKLCTCNKQSLGFYRALNTKCYIYVLILYLLLGSFSWPTSEMWNYKELGSWDKNFLLFLSFPLCLCAFISFLRFTSSITIRKTLMTDLVVLLSHLCNYFRLRSLVDGAV